MVEALRRSAPPSDSPNDRLYSEWKVQPETLKGWSKYCLKQELTPTQFENTAIARKVVSCITRRELDKQLHATKNNETAAVGSVACWWMTGEYTGCDSGFTSDYVQKVVGFYQQQRSKRVSSASKAPPENKMPSRLIDRTTDTWSRWVSQPFRMGHGWAFYFLDLPK